MKERRTYLCETEGLGDYDKHNSKTNLESMRLELGSRRQIHLDIVVIVFSFFEGNSPLVYLVLLIKVSANNRGDGNRGRGSSLTRPMARCRRS